MLHKRTVIAVAAFLLVTVPAITAAPKKPSAKCPKKLSDCPDEGCSPEHRFDANLNRRKNLTPKDASTKGAAEPMTLQAMKHLPEPEDFDTGGSRDGLTALGEGKKIRVTAFLLTVRPEEGESCNCELDDKKQHNEQIAVNTDNHLVLVSGETVKKFRIADGINAQQWKANLALREKESITAEFTPRVRLSHPNFTRAALSPLIKSVPQMALRVRVTGMLLFDSEHLKRKLHRVNNWEIHPILKFEFCPRGTTCTADSDAGWKSLDER